MRTIWACSELARRNRRSILIIPTPQSFNIRTIGKIWGFPPPRTVSPESDVKTAISKHPGRKYHAVTPSNFTFLKEGDPLCIGEYSFECVENPGHTRGHMCLYESRTKLFFSGDTFSTILRPTFLFGLKTRTRFRQFLQSLDKIDTFEIDRVFPGHRKLFNDHRRRIAELKKHHELRNEEVIAILPKGRLNAYQVAGQMTWDIDCDRWEDFPLPSMVRQRGGFGSLAVPPGGRPAVKGDPDGKVFFFFGEGIDPLREG